MTARWKCLAAMLAACFAPSLVAAQAAPGAEFKKLAERLAADRLGGVDSPQDLQEKALALLDGLVVDELQKSSSEAPPVAAISQKLAGTLKSDSQVGAGIQLVVLSARGREPIVALAVNFGFGGPAAIRIYAKRDARWERTGRVDRFTHKVFFDESLVLVPFDSLSANGPPNSSVPAVLALLAVTGRTDDFQSGAFFLWRVARGVPELEWQTDVLPQTSYEVSGGILRLSYCSEPDEERPRLCRQTARDAYRWDGSAWTRTEHIVSPRPQP